ncbi:MAG: bis(5'-nucleosyl)-tetraphosphatase (symmetrical) YqeK [Clostridia bacterium]|nr:bis(5'-nucleosyl)-tetraphosphatase (symmetrical) YqeK [Clostridia bacterium]
MPTVSGMTEERFLKLRLAVSQRIGTRRFSHTLGVESAIIELGERYLPGEIPRLRVAALLHDVTKEWSPVEQVAFCEKHGLPLTDEERSAPRILHAKTGAFVAARDFSAYVDKGILQAIALHTTGAEDMTVFDELLYLADYIEPTRTYADCRALRAAFFEGYDAADDTLEHLHATVKEALLMTVSDIHRAGGTVCTATLEAVAFLDRKLSANS